ncbi:hypothetical protein ABGB18_09490 [Nonomuraea sp. B12E4]|uniref:hypothetical protein n=1 Tax=Nonomuraea sp. B12E4 TaxID=3153564 RepID=UPI00325F6014
MKSKDSGIGWLLVLGMALVGLAGTPDDRSAPERRAPVAHDREAKAPSSDEPPDITCEGGDCWWADLGRPNR